MLDEEMAGRLQRKFDGEAILSKLLAKNQDESDARLARELHKKVLTFIVTSDCSLQKCPENANMSKREPQS